MAKIYQVYVIGVTGDKMLVDLCNTEVQMRNMTVSQLREKIAERLPNSIDGEGMRLIFTDKPLDNDDHLLSSYGIQHESVIQVVLRLHGGLKLYDSLRWT